MDAPNFIPTIPERPKKHMESFSKQEDAILESVDSNENKIYSRSDINMEVPTIPKRPTKSDLDSERSPSMPVIPKRPTRMSSDRLKKSSEEESNIVKLRKQPELKLEKSELDSDNSSSGKSHPVDKLNTLDTGLEDRSSNDANIENTSISKPKDVENASELSDSLRNVLGQADESQSVNKVENLETLNKKQYEVDDITSNDYFEICSEEGEPNRHEEKQGETEGNHLDHKINDPYDDSNEIGKLNDSVKFDLEPETNKEKNKNNDIYVSQIEAEELSPIDLQVAIKDSAEKLSPSDLQVSVRDLNLADYIPSIPKRPLKQTKDAKEEEWKKSNSDEEVKVKDNADTLKIKSFDNEPRIPLRPRRNNSERSEKQDDAKKNNNSTIDIDTTLGSKPESIESAKTTSDHPVIKSDTPNGLSDQNKHHKAPPPKPKKLSSKIAAFQQMFNAEPDVEPSETKPHSRIYESTSRPSRLSSDKMKFAESLKGMMGKGMALPGMVDPNVIVESNVTESKEDTLNELPKDETRILNSRPVRTKGPKGKRLPKTLKEPANIESEPSFQKSTRELWRLSFAKKEHPRSSIGFEQVCINHPGKKIESSTEDLNVDSLSFDQNWKTETFSLPINDYESKPIMDSQENLNLIDYPKSNDNTLIGEALESGDLPSMEDSMLLSSSHSNVGALSNADNSSNQIENPELNKSLDSSD
ncbi:uncharacterized protein PRCAT00005273001 [Priceomyces carsonii]|uniref:uncharacterized protein n=1 Tax=Priceomyces carsonii TaxID=28549 RepID=UPI002ED799E2|nr:unnamed protein product [Priceomyces carsonii]